MCVFQFDENSSARSLIRDCRNAGVVEVRKYPSGDKGLPDEDMLDKYVQRDGVIVTFDAGLVQDHLDHVPDDHPGVIIVRHSPAISYPMTAASAKNILDHFKAEFSDWHRVSWKNSVVTMTEASIEVGHVASDHVVNDLSKSYNESEWQAELRDCLSRIASGS